TTTANTTTDYNYPTGAMPHSVTNAVTGSTTLSYGYDNIGNTTCRPVATTANTCPGGANSQTLTWDPEGRLATLSTGGQTHRYTYTTDGTRLVADTPTTTTLYLPGMELVRTKSSGAVTATRYYVWAGETCAQMTTGGALVWLIGDHQGTQATTVTAGTQAITTRLQMPYGVARGAGVSWPNPKGFVGGDNDPTGLVHIGAREYDAGLGRFISVDSLFESENPLSLNGYSYADNTPVTRTDPTGLSTCNYTDVYAQYYCQNANSGSGGGGGGGGGGSGGGSGSGGGCTLNDYVSRTCGSGSSGAGPSVTIRVTITFPTDKPVPIPTAPPPGSTSARTGPSKTPTPSAWGDGLPLPAGCKMIGQTGAYDCPGSDTEGGIKMFGVCFGGDIGAYVGYGGSICLAFDGKGVGLMETFGGHEGVTFGGFYGPGIIFSGGDIEDQKDQFKYVTGGGGYGVSGYATYSYGQSSMTGEDVWTVDIMVGPGGGGSLVGGQSTTYVQRLEYSQIADWFGG
ncbi:RHS repeat-associated core domain-containing protein, partial [Luedemannella flava]|uniref:RHS repeat-associated core domain-containing protein n=1 Tax=Luedemannella flava TaxID=349316 RepID=UPI0031DDA4A9